MSNTTVTVNIEICQESKSSLNSSDIKRLVKQHMEKEEELILDIKQNASIPHVNYYRVCSDYEDIHKVKVSESVEMLCHVYQLWSEGPQIDSLEDENDEVPTSINWSLPNVAFEGLWENLILEHGIKEQLLNYVQTTFLYSCKQVNSQIVHWNGVVLLHGPPGTGKTSLSRALAQKLSIRLNARYKTSQLIEINTHSLFSKWFSESAKLVLKIFTSIKQWLQANDHFVCILIDEIESLTHVRQANGVEPSDSIRVVNAILTQIDQLQRYQNVLILATSNVTEIIDTAFADRADLKLFIPHPSMWGAYEILRSGVDELIRCNLIEGTDTGAFFEAVLFKKLACNADAKCGGDAVTRVMKRSEQLLNVSQLCKDLSGRTLRKIPFLTSTKFINKPIPTVEKFVHTMLAVIEKHKMDDKQFFKNS